MPGRNHNIRNNVRNNGQQASQVLANFSRRSCAHHLFPILALTFLPIFTRNWEYNNFQYSILKILQYFQDSRIFLGFSDILKILRYSQDSRIFSGFSGFSEILGILGYSQVFWIFSGFSDILRILRYFQIFSGFS